MPSPVSTPSLLILALTGLLALDIGPAHADDCIPIETFAAAKPGEFPPGWRLRKDAGKTACTVQEEGAR